MNGIRCSPEHKQLEVWVGEWSYEGSAPQNPFEPAGKFKGKSVSRMVLGGFFLETREQDKSDVGYIWEGMVLFGYDPIAKSLVSYGFENDGTVGTAKIEVNGNTWTFTGTRVDSEGKTWKTRNVHKFSLADTADSADTSSKQLLGRALKLLLISS
jgi:hypothetical protein